MPSTTSKQRGFFGVVMALKTHHLKPSQVTKDVRDAAKEMTKKQIKHFLVLKSK